MLVLIAYATKIPLNTHADLFNGAKCLNLDMKTSSFVCVCEQRLARAFIARLCDKY